MTPLEPSAGDPLTAKRVRDRVQYLFRKVADDVLARALASAVLEHRREREGEGDHER